MTTKYTVTLLHEAVVGLRRLQGFANERELAIETPDWTTPQRALDAIREGMRLLSWSPNSFRRAELGNGRSREWRVPFGANLRHGNPERGGDCVHTLTHPAGSDGGGAGQAHSPLP